jgi:hypothetical protein
LLVAALGIFIMTACMVSASIDGVNAVYWCAWGGNTSFQLGTDYLPPAVDITSYFNHQQWSYGKSIKDILNTEKTNKK